jgi:SH3-like domain-containing protein
VKRVFAPQAALAARLIAAGLAAGLAASTAAASPAATSTAAASPATSPTATAYVSDDLVLGVFADQSAHGARLATLHSGMSVEVLGTDGEFSQVRLSDDRTGWVKSSYLVTAEPAAARIKRLEEELSNVRATTPALAQAAARTEVAQLKAALAAKEAELRSARAAYAAPSGAARSPPLLAPPQSTPHSALSPSTALARAGWFAGTTSLALALGFSLGYAALARRIRQKFGGIKVY